MPCLMKISETKTRRIEDTSRILQLNPKTPVAGHFSLFCPVCTLKEHFTSKSIPPITCSAIFICPGTRWHSSCGAQGIKKKKQQLSSNLFSWYIMYVPKVTT